ncbi:hypothetical protein BSNK01_30480 [Bacillaceae bacterium]
MSIKTKLALTFSMMVTVILILNNALHYFSMRETLRENQLRFMELTAKEISIAIENSEKGSKYVEDLIGEKLRIASLVVKYALDPKAENVTNEELRRLRDEIGVSHITLFQKVGDDIVGVRSTDPHEINLSTKEWGYWFEALQQLLKQREVTIPQGQKLPNYWSGPIDVSSSNPNHFDKWGYFYDGTTDYIIDPYERDLHLKEFENITGLKNFIARTLENNDIILEISGFNPETFGIPPKITRSNGVEYVRLTDRPILFGQYTYKDEARDLQHVQEAWKTGTHVSYETEINGKQVMKSFFPVRGKNPYVIGVVTDTRWIRQALQEQLKYNLIISLFILTIVYLGSYFVAALFVKPIHQILKKVKRISKGDFTSWLPNKRKDELGLLAEGINRMSASLEKYTRQMKRQAYYDHLTDLPNRRLFNKKLSRLLEEVRENGQTLAVMFIDLDRFKLINDVFGHAVGDQLLKLVAERLKFCLRYEDIISRIGGDEFTVVLPGMTQQTAEPVAQRILDVLTQPFMIEGHELFVTPSIGISLYPEDGDDADTLIRNADTAMYRAKDQGKNNYQFFTSEMREAFFKKIRLEEDLRKALKRQEFLILYQPQVNVQSGQITGMEALLRWKHPELGLISPADFIPIAEETGLIVPIGEWVMRTVCRENKALQEAGFPPLRVAINLSAQQVQQQDFVQTVKRILEETGMDPRRLSLEITESTAMQYVDLTIEKLQRLKELGIQISIDDFGTGYSSLSYLRRFPINTLKIDKSFVNDINSNTDNTSIITTIIAMARNMKLNVIAEGVETVEQLNFLRKNHCYEVQGYLFGKPLSLGEMKDHFRHIEELAASASLS